jgi:uncharacterized protein YegP (UPF0339 family)
MESLDPREYYFDLWHVRGWRGTRWYWHLKSNRNHEIVFSGQSSGYKTRAGAMHGIHIARAVGWNTVMQELPLGRK